jgi:DNA-binding SARP family transcriptional activator
MANSQSKDTVACTHCQGKGNIIAKLSLAWFGFGSANIGDKPLQFRTRKAEALLMVLTTEAALHNGSPIRREALLGLLWPGYSEKSARQNLRSNLSYLRSALSCMEQKGGAGTFSDQ